MNPVVYLPQSEEYLPIQQILLCVHGQKKSPELRDYIQGIVGGLEAVMNPLGVDIKWEIGASNWVGAVESNTDQTGIVVPLLFSSGYFYQYRLKPLLKRHPNLQLAAPLGFTPATLDYMADRIGNLLSAQGMSRDETQILLVGEGNKTRALYKSGLTHVIDGLAKRGLGAEAVFLEGYPSLRTALNGAKNHLILPYMMGLDAKVQAQLDLLLAAENGTLGRRVIVDTPIGQHENLVDLILASAGFPPRAHLSMPAL